MGATVLPPRMLAQIRLALLGDCGCQHRLAQLDAAARSAGLSGAEIDAALGGSSFEARAAAAVGLACALKSGDPQALADARQRSERIGLTAAERRAIRRAASAILKVPTP